MFIPVWIPFTKKKNKKTEAHPFRFGCHALNSSERSIHLKHSIPAEINYLRPFRTIVFI